MCAGDFCLELFPKPQVRKHQASVVPLTFILCTGRQIKRHSRIERFLESQIREAFGFRGTSIWFKMRARNAERRE